MGSGHPPAVPGFLQTPSAPKRFRESLLARGGGGGRLTGLGRAPEGTGVWGRKPGRSKRMHWPGLGRDRREDTVPGLARSIHPSSFPAKALCPSHSQKRKGSRAKRRAVRQPRPDEDSSKRPGARGQGCLRAGSATCPLSLRAAEGA